MAFLFQAPGLQGDLYARGLGYTLRSYRLYDYDYALARDPEVYERLRRDAVVAFALRYRKLLAAGRDWYLEPANATDADRKLTQILTHLLKEMDHFDMSRFQLAEAVIAGSRWAKIEGEERTVAIEGVGESKWWVCSRLRDIDKRRFRQFAIDQPDGSEKVRWGTPEAPPAEINIRRRRWVWQIFRPLQQMWQEIDRDDYVRHVYDEREDTLGYGGGLASELYTYWYAKEIALQHGLQYLERWSQGILIAHVDTLRDGKASYPTSAQRFTDWLSTFEKMRSRHILVADAKDRVDVKDAPTGGWQAALEAIRYLDGAIRVAILGSSLPTQSDVEGGSYALAEVQQDTTEALAAFDMVCLEESLRRDLLGWLYRKNYAAFRSLGVANCTLPYIKLRDCRREDPAEAADVLLKVRQAGMRIRTDEAYARTGFSIPSDVDSTLPPLGSTLPELGEMESQRQGGPPAGVRPGAADPTKDQGRKILGVKQSEQAARNPLRPDNVAGPKGLREKAIDSQTSPFAAEAVPAEDVGAPAE